MLDNIVNYILKNNELIIRSLYLEVSELLLHNWLSFVHIKKTSMMRTGGKPKLLRKYQKHVIKDITKDFLYSFYVETNDETNFRYLHIN